MAIQRTGRVQGAIQYERQWIHLPVTGGFRGLTPGVEAAVVDAVCEIDRLAEDSGRNQNVALTVRLHVTHEESFDGEVWRHAVRKAHARHDRVPGRAGR